MRETFTLAEWDAATDHSFAIGMALGAFLFGDWPWYECIAYGAFLLAFFTLFRRARARLSRWMLSRRTPAKAAGRTSEPA